ncbi:hypothetical protein Bbelb_338790 [Branchiostoma belcheri]|nr:hypothetical protein Bbelb_338790 [Branchiostoma belcheri]
MQTLCKLFPSWWAPSITGSPHADPLVGPQCNGIPPCRPSYSQIDFHSLSASRARYLLRLSVESSVLGKYVAPETPSLSADTQEGGSGQTPAGKDNIVKRRGDGLGTDAVTYASHVP